MASMFCPECGAQVQSEDPFCGECGARQEPVHPPPPPVVVEAEKAAAADSKGSGEKKSKVSTSNVQLDPDALLLERYVIVRRVGGGGMGSVYLARDKRLADRPCAVKEMIELFADENQRTKAVDDFKREAEVLAQLEHPSIPTIFDYFVEGGRYYLVMKWIGGGDLAEQMRMRGGAVDEPTVCRWAIQICDVLHYIHTQRPPIIYRDLKPANLMLDDKSGRVMLVDFGIARIVRPTEKGVTAIGTMGYAPPELFSGKVEPRSDIYSLGATMFHMLTGSDPQDNPLLIFDFSKNPRPSQINPSITPGMEQILMRAVAYKPEDRHGSGMEFMRVLEEHLSRSQGDSRQPPQIGIGNMARQPMGATPFSPVPAPPSKPGIGSGRPLPELPAGWVYCGHCGKQIASDDVFCPHCGWRQPISAGANQGGRITAQLLVVGTSDVVKPFRLDKDNVLLGRMDPNTGIFPEIDLTMYDPETKISRRHAMITRQGEQFFIEDLQSVNGTTVISSGGSVRLNPKSPRVLSAGDELMLGETKLKFMIV